MTPRTAAGSDPVERDYSFLDEWDDTGQEPNLSGGVSPGMGSAQSGFDSRPRHYLDLDDEAGVERLARVLCDEAHGEGPCVAMEQHRYRATAIVERLREGS